MDKLLSVKARLEKSGIDSEIIEIRTGIYFNPDPHFIDISTLEIHCRDYYEYTAAEKIISRIKGIKSRIWNYSTKTIHVITDADFEKSEQAKNTANKFQNAFWLAIHNGANQEAAIIAGNSAIA